MTASLRAEWTKLRTQTATGWLLGGAAILTIAVSVAIAASFHISPGSRQPEDPTKLALSGIDVGQAVVAVLAVLAISDEYATGMIRVTLTAMPRRAAVLAAKAANLAGLTLAAGIVAVAGSLAAGRLGLPGDGLDPAHGYPLVTLADPATLRAAAGTVVYLILIALLSLGIATAVRDTAVSIGAVLGLLYVFPILAQAVSDPWRRLIQQIAPMNAGLAIQATTHLRSLPIGPWAGLGVLAAWAAAALGAGGVLLHRRDA